MQKQKKRDGFGVAAPNNNTQSLPRSINASLDTISIAELLDIVKDNDPEILSKMGENKSIVDEVEIYNILKGARAKK